MNALSLTTPALLFPAISLLLLAYTNRYIAISNRIRTLHAEYKKEKSEIIIRQIVTLKKRIRLIRDMQLLGIVSIFISAFTMFLMYQNYTWLAQHMFTLSLIFLLISLFLSAWEIILSNKALYMLLEDTEEELHIPKRKFFNFDFQKSKIR